VLIADLEIAVQEGQHDKRVAILRQVTDLLVVGADVFNDDHVQLFGDVLTRLTEQVENKELAELSAKLAPVGNARGDKSLKTVISNFSQNFLTCYRHGL